MTEKPATDAITNWLWTIWETLRTIEKPYQISQISSVSWAINVLERWSQRNLPTASVAGSMGLAWFQRRWESQAASNSIRWYDAIWFVESNASCFIEETAFIPQWRISYVEVHYSSIAQLVERENVLTSSEQCAIFTPPLLADLQLSMARHLLKWNLASSPSWLQALKWRIKKWCLRILRSSFVIVKMILFFHRATLAVPLLILLTVAAVVVVVTLIALQAWFSFEKNGLSLSPVERDLYHLVAVRPDTIWHSNTWFLQWFFQWFFLSISESSAQLQAWHHLYVAVWLVLLWFFRSIALKALVARPMGTSYREDMGRH